MLLLRAHARAAKHITSSTFILITHLSFVHSLLYPGLPHDRREHERLYYHGSTNILLISTEIWSGHGLRKFALIPQTTARIN